MSGLCSFFHTFSIKQGDQYVIANHNFTQSIDKVYIIDNRNESSAPLNFSYNKNGDWYFNDNSYNLYYIGQTF